MRGKTTFVLVDIVLILLTSFILAAAQISQSPSSQSPKSQTSLDNIPWDLAFVSHSSCVTNSSYTTVVNGQTGQKTEKVIVDAVASVEYRGEPTAHAPWKNKLISSYSAEIVADNTVEETLNLGSRDCVRWVSMMKRLTEEAQKEGLKKASEDRKKK